MCGEIEEEDGQTRFENALFARFRSHAGALLAENEKKAGASSDALHAYMDKLFGDALSRSLRDGEGAGDDKQYARLAAQPLVFARLAGFLAAHASLHEDPLRKVMEALMMGYAEAESVGSSHDHDHGHDHHHDHGHHH